MLHRKSLLTIFLTAFSSFLFSQTKFIIVDQFGYLPGVEKIAVIKNPEIGFDSERSFTPGTLYSVIEKSTGKKLMTGAPVAWKEGNIHYGSGDRVWYFDFSELTTPGTYYILDEQRGHRSYDFIIAENVYNEVLKHAMRSFFYQRSGFPKAAEYAGEEWADGASHIGPLQDNNCRSFFDKTNPATEKDLSGGWYDAGDYNKYTNWTANYVVQFMRAYLEKPSAWGDDYNIPESGNGIPDILDEAKWGIDHLLRMQQEDGSVLSIVGAAHGSPPSSVTGPSYYGPPNTSASLNTAASFAIASKVYRGIGMDKYADTLLNAAVNAWNWAQIYPDSLFNNNDPAYNSQGLGAGRQEVNDYNRLMIKLEAASYLFEVTGDVQYRDFFDANYKQSHLFQWKHAYPFEHAHQDALLYYSTLENATSTVKEDILNVFKNSMMNGDENMKAHENKTDAYLAYLKAYTWGSNGVKSSHGGMFYNLITYYPETTDSTIASNAALKYVNYIHGVNPLNFVYLSNMYDYGADSCVNEFYHSWFTDGSALWDRVGESLYGPPPGYLTGGANPSYNWDACCPNACGGGNNSKCTSESLTPPKGQPDQKSYKDWNTSWPQNSWEVTENSCGYQTAYIRLLSKFVNPEIDCNGVIDGTAFIDSCGNCAGGNTGMSPSLSKDDCDFIFDCHGVENGAAFIDSCGNCAGEYTGITPVLDTSQCREPVPEYEVIIRLMDSYNNELFWGVNVELADEAKVSDGSGEVRFTLPEGEYAYTIEKLSYRSESGNIDLSSDTIIEFYLVRTHASVKFRLKNGTTPVNNATVHLSDDSLVTNSLGIAHFQNIPVGQEYSYRISKEGFERVEGSVALNTDTSININMTLTSLQQTGLKEAFEFWPNPATEKITCSFNAHPNRVRIRILDLKGRIIIDKKPMENEISIAIGSLPGGLYIIQYMNQSASENFLLMLGQE
jgi:hypothetical protein